MTAGEMKSRYTRNPLAHKGNKKWEELNKIEDQWKAKYAKEEEQKRAVAREARRQRN